MASDPSDLNACLGGDPRAWAGFVDRWSPVILATVRRTFRAHAGTVDADAVEDVTQDVFVRLVKNDFRLLASYDAARASLATWLTIVARSAAIDALRRRRGETVPLDESHVGSAPPSVAEPGPDLPMHVLTTRQRLVLRMLFRESMSVAEAARMLGVDEQTIRSTKHKALNRLREHLRS